VHSRLEPFKTALSLLRIYFFASCLDSKKWIISDFCYHAGSALGHVAAETGQFARALAVLWQWMLYDAGTAALVELHYSVWQHS